MISDNIKVGHYFRIDVKFISKTTMVSAMLLILLTSILPASAVINATSVEIRGTMWNDTSANNLNYWTPLDFQGFFYDIKDNLGTERLTIDQYDLASWDNSYWLPEQRVIGKNNLTYTTTAQPTELKVASALGLAGNNSALTAKGLEQAAPGKDFDGGRYWIVGWQGEKYVAVKGKIEKLSKLLLEHGTSSGDMKNLTVGETWEIGDGWTLKANSTAVISSQKKAQLILSMNGIHKNETTINESRIFTYVEGNLSNETDVPLFVTYVNNISGNIVQLRYTWVISNNVTNIKSSDTYGKFKDAAVWAGGKALALKNSDSTVTLLRDTTIDLIGNIKFKVADSNVLRFYPMVIRNQPGTYEVHGTVWNDTTLNNMNFWNPMNFPGFFYDIKDNLGTENLTIDQGIDYLAGSENSEGLPEDRVIGKNNLTYFTTAQAKMLNVVMALNLQTQAEMTMRGLEQADRGFAGGKYWILGWQGEKYVAINGKADKLSRLILEQGTSASDKKTLTVGETWELGGGWALTANSIDAKASPRQVWITLSRDGVKKDDRVITSGGTDSKPIYTYVEKSLGGESDVPVFVTYVDSVFAGATTDMVQLRYTWVISSSVTEIRSGETYGIFNDAIIMNSGKTLGLRNSDSTISLARGTTIDLMNNLKFKVADSDTLRFYPFVTYEVFPLPPPPPPPKPFDTLKFEPYVWNLVSVPKTLVNPAVNTAFGNLSLDPNNIKWLFNGSAWDHPSNIIPLRGYWVFNNASTPIFQKLNYRDMSGPNVPPSMPLKAGWNLIGHTSAQPMAVESALISIKGKYSHILTYSPSGGWKMYIVGNPDLQQFSAFEPGKGYWIFMTEDATYAAVDI